MAMQGLEVNSSWLLLPFVPRYRPCLQKRYDLKRQERCCNRSRASHLCGARIIGIPSQHEYQPRIFCLFRSAFTGRESPCLVCNHLRPSHFLRPGGTSHVRIYREVIPRVAQQDSGLVDNQLHSLHKPQRLAHASKELGWLTKNRCIW